MGRVSNLASCVGVLWFLLRENTTEGFFNMRGTWHLSQHFAPLRFSVLWPDNFPNMLHHYGFPYYGLTTPACNMPGFPHSATWGIQPSCSVDRVLCTIKLPFTTSLVLLQAYSFDTRTHTGLIRI